MTDSIKQSGNDECGGTLQRDGLTYQWWAGQANKDADSRRCVHCWEGDLGVTRYLDADIDSAAAEKIAAELIDTVRAAQAAGNSAAA